MAQLLFRIWTLPNTLLGTFIGLIGLVTGGKAQWKRGCVEFYGGGTTWLLTKTPLGKSIAAMTLGHTILGVNQQSLDRARNHEHIHVKQYERWGPFFIPAYFAASGYMWWIKRDPYLDNPFEVQAYEQESIPPK